MAGSAEHMAKMRAARKRKATPPARRLSYVDELRRQRLPQQEDETRLMYARRKAGWPPLRSKA